MTRHHVSVFKCCTDNDGRYLAGPATHNPDLPGDGPWYVVQKRDGEVVESLGYGTKPQALEALSELLQAIPGIVTIQVDPWD